MQLQQGDVTLTKIPDWVTGGVTHDRTLVVGEATGHHHTLEDTPGLEVRAVKGVLYARIVEPTQLVHQEHRALTVPPGIWKVGRVREYDHFAEDARPVVD